jgi:hypothetical protein
MAAQAALVDCLVAAAVLVEPELETQLAAAALAVLDMWRSTHGKAICSY